MKGTSAWFAKPITGRAITHEPIQSHPHSSNPTPPTTHHHNPRPQTHQLTKATTVVREGVMRKWVIGRGMGEKERANGDRCGGERGENKTKMRTELRMKRRDRRERINLIKKIIQ